MLAFIFTTLYLCVNSQWIYENPQLPFPLGEMSSAYIASTLYVVGQGSSSTCKLTLSPRSSDWNCNLAQRPYVGNHHAVVNSGDGSVWLIGGLGTTSPFPPKVSLKSRRAIDSLFQVLTMSFERVAKDLLCHSDMFQMMLLTLLDANL